MWYLFCFCGNGSSAETAGANITLTTEAVRSSECPTIFETSSFRKPEDHMVIYLNLLLVLLSS